MLFQGRRTVLAGAGWLVLAAMTPEEAGATAAANLPNTSDACGECAGTGIIPCK